MKEIYESEVRGWICTFSWRGHSVLLAGFLQGQRDAQELHVGVPVPHQELLARSDLFAGLVEDLPLRLHGHHVLLIWEASAFHQRHPVPGASPAVHKVTQPAVFKHLEEGKMFFFCH